MTLVSKIIKTFSSNNTDDKIAFLKRCPDSFAMAIAEEYVSQPHLEVNLAGLNMLAETYSRGIDCNLGVALSEAIYRLTQQALLTTSCEEYSYGAYLFCAGNSLNSWLLGLNALGQYQSSVRVGEEALKWLKEKSYKESQEHQCMLRLSMIEAYIGLAHANNSKQNELFFLTSVKELLDATEADKNNLNKNKAYRITLEQLWHKYNELVQDAIILPDEKKRIEQSNQKKIIIDKNLDVLKQSSEAIKRIAPEIAESLEKLRQNPSNNSASEWAIKNRDTADQIANFLRAPIFQLQKQIRNACLIFADPVRGKDQKLIQNSLNILQKARHLAQQNHFIEEENDALWGLYLCYSRSKQEDLAIDALQSLRHNLELLRNHIAEPMERAGVFQKFPYLFASLCQLLCRAGRSAELLNAIEGAKGRVLADVLTENRGKVVEDSAFSEPVKYLPELMQQVHAHYLSYFVDEESTYAVLVAKDGSVHSHEIALGKQTLREWSKNVNPKFWGTTTYSGLKEIKIPDDLPERLSKLVIWLEPFAKSGLIEREDHICYCPDEELHLVPLHYVTFLNEPFVKYVSLSRIHGASALILILRQSPEYFTQAVAIQVSSQQEKEAKQDEKVKAKLYQIARTPNWLLKNLSTQLLKDEEANLKALCELNLRYKLIHFSTHGTFPEEGGISPNHEPNPYTGSGLLLSIDEKLPDEDKFSKLLKVENPNLLTPEKALDLELLGSHISMMACVSGLSKEGIGGDALGLEWAFLQAGANSLLSTHWNVDATAAAEFSLRFYDKWLNQRFPRSAAWRETVLELMSYQWSSDEHCSTYYWAAFSLSGNWR